MKNENSRNTIIFIVCSALILGVYWFAVLRPQAERRAVQQQAQAEQSQTAENAARTALSPQGPTFVTDRSQALSTAARVPIQSGTLKGSLSLQGGRIDDLFLTDYKETQDKPEPVELFRPQGMQNAYFAQFGWTGPNVAGGVPGPNTVWRLTAGSTLTPTTPVTLTWDNGQGLRFTRVVSVDDRYVFSIQDTVQNLGTQAITIAPYGSVQRQGVPPAGRFVAYRPRGRDRHLRQAGRLPDRAEEVQGLAEGAPDRERLDRRLAGHHRQILAGGPAAPAERGGRDRIPRPRRQRRPAAGSQYPGRGPHHPARREPRPRPSACSPASSAPRC
jgi:hypothetical protein